MVVAVLRLKEDAYRGTYALIFTRVFLCGILFTALCCAVCRYAHTTGNFIAKTEKFLQIRSFSVESIGLENVEAVQSFSCSYGDAGLRILCNNYLDTSPVFYSLINSV